MLSPQHTSQAAKVKKSPSFSPAGSSRSDSILSSMSDLSLSASGSSSRTSSMRESRRSLSSENIYKHFEDADDYVVLHTEVQVKEEIGKGTFGTVYKGVFEDKVVAIKILNTVNEKDFIREVKQTKLDHPCITGLIALVAEPENNNNPAYYYIVTKYAGGGSLSVYLKNHSRLEDSGWSWHMTIAYDIICGLYFLHSKNIIHRDLTSDNVLLSEDYAHAMLGDFGLAITKASNCNTVNAEQCGTTKYMAPELLQVVVDEAQYSQNNSYALFKRFWELMRPLLQNSKCPYSFASDIYALGILLWELFHHQKPFQGHIATLDLFNKIISDNFRPTIKDDVPVEFANLIRKCWDKRIDQRPATEQVFDTIFRLKN
ncbi:MAG: protein kinase [Gammaproteobacteria bacterium]|jgi:serine/threonine protein kinase